MAIEFTLPAKVGAGASAAAAGSLAIAGGAGAFNGSPATQVETEQNSEGNISNPETPLGNQDFSEGAKPQTTPELTKGPTEITEAKTVVKSEPAKPLKTIAEISSNNYLDKTVGKVYAKYLVSARSTDQDSNQDWWNKKFSEYQNKSEEQRETGNPFTNKPTSGYSSDLESASTSLNARCDAIYKENFEIEKLKKSEEIKNTPGDDDEEDEKYTISTWDDLWNYCSDFLAPQTIKSANVGEFPKQGTWGKELEDKVLIVNGGYNTKFWKVLNEEFFSLEAGKISDAYFKSFRETTTNTTETNPLKEKCSDIYKLNKDDTPSNTNPSKDAILKYCSLEGE